MLVSLGDAGFVAAAERLGEPVLLITVEQEQDLREEQLEDAWLLHLPGSSLFTEPARRAVEIVRRRNAMVAVDLAGSDAPARDGAQLAFELAKLRPDILLATRRDAEALGVPLEGLSRLPVLLLGERGAELFGRRVPAPPGAGANPSAFAAALCSAYLDGAMPVEAAGRAMVYAAGIAENLPGSSQEGAGGPPVI
ncbi:MAG TPA: hypothetical protein VF137_11795 [Candidatus Dormibacteraeota bacterium]